MDELEAIKHLSKETEHLPKSSFYLGLADILTENAASEIKNNERDSYREKTIERIWDNFDYAIELFSEDKKLYEKDQKNGFLERKIYVKNKIELLVKKNEKKNIKEKKKAEKNS